MILRTVRQAAILTSFAALILWAGPLSANVGMGGKGMEKMGKELGLTKDQSVKMKALHDSGAETAKALRAKMADDAKRLNGLVKDKSSDAVIGAATSEVIADHRRMMDAQMEHQDALQAILTPTQYAKVLVEMCDRMHGKSMGMGDDD